MLLWTYWTTLLGWCWTKSLVGLEEGSILGVWPNLENWAISRMLVGLGRAIKYWASCYGLGPRSWTKLDQGQNGNFTLRRIIGFSLSINYDNDSRGVVEAAVRDYLPKISVFSLVR